MSRTDPHLYYKRIKTVQEQADLDPVNIQSNIVFDVLRKKQRSGSREYDKYTEWIERVIKTIDSGLAQTNA